MGVHLLDLTDLLDVPDLVVGPDGVPFAVVGRGALIGQARDQARRYGLDLVDPTTGASLAGLFGDSTAVRAIAWAGGDGTTLATPAAHWADAPAAQLFLDVLPADLAALECQPYPLRIECLTGPGWLEVWSGTLRVDPAPGLAAPPLVYAAYRDLDDQAGDSLDSLRSEREGAGLLRSRVEASRWLDGVILARYRPVGGWGLGGGGFDPSLGRFASIEAPNPTIRDYLASAYLILTDQVRRIVAAKALGFAFGRQLGSPEYRGYSRRFHAAADNDVRCLVAQIDTNADGYADLTINCGTINMRGYC